jgi:putative SOS response-associated peptidase YedK
MCTRYITPEQAAIERHWHVGRANPLRWTKTEVFPGRPGLFIRATRDGTDTRNETVVGQWGLIPWFAKSAKLPYSTSNARSEELSAKATFKHPWARGQRCIIPAESFDEPNWESGKNVWWRFRRADATPWGLAGLWNTWVDKATGEIVESYTMLTINADAHPLMRRMHKPDLKVGPDEQDKRSVIPIALADVDEWLTASVEQAASLLRVPSLEVFEAGPV